MSRLAETEALATDTEELGLAAALVAAQCRAAGLMPEAFGAVIGAALTLGAPMDGLYAAAEPIASDRDLRTAAEQLEGDAGEMLTSARRARATAEAERDAAYEKIRQAHRQNDTKSGEVADCASSEAADCDAAIDIADVLIQRLEYVIRRLGEVPDDIGVTYEVPYDHIRRGGVLPHSGDFLDATTTTTMEGAA